MLLRVDDIVDSRFWEGDVSAYEPVKGAGENRIAEQSELPECRVIATPYICSLMAATPGRCRTTRVSGVSAQDGRCPKAFAHEEMTSG